MYQNKLEKACFHHEMAYGDFKDLTKRAASEKISHNNESNIAKNPKYQGYQRGLAPVFYTVLIKRLLAVVLKMRIF